MSGVPRALHLVQPRRAPQTATVFDKIAVVGLGVIGGSLALAAREAWPSALVIGVDENEVLEKAMLRHAVDVASRDLGIAGDAGLIVLARTVEENLALLQELPRYLEGPAIVTDVGPSKVAMVEAARGLPPRLTFIAGHPLVEPCAGGIEAARSDLFADRHWILTPTEGGGGPAFERLWNVATALGAVPAAMTAAQHDRLFAWLGYLPGVMAAALLDGAGRSIGADGLAFAGSDFSGVARLIPSAPDAWPGVWPANAAEIAPALDELIALLKEIRQDLSGGDAVDRLFASARAWRQRLPPTHP
jgi:prephenate dehydrogenase